MTYLRCVAALALAGCAGGDDLETSAASSRLGCDNPLICPGNSDLMGVLGPYELDEEGKAFSSRGFRIKSMTHAEQKVEDFYLVRGSPRVHRNDGTLQTGANLVGLKMILEHVDGHEIVLAIDGYLVGKVPYYTGEPSRIEGFHVTYTVDGEGEPTPLCPYTEHVDTGIAGDWVVFWKGDRIDPATGYIFASDAAVGSWFNISCAGEAPIKMLRAKAGGATDVTSTVAQRQATLNMFTASYCGPTGQRYTELGQEITWSDLTGPSQIGKVSSHEAVWTAAGAACIDTPRMVDRDEIGCRIPSCNRSHILNWQSYGLLLSGNPLKVP